MRAGVRVDSWQRHLSPRAAGWLAIAGSVALAVVGAILLAMPPWSIPGAIVLVGATILLSIGGVWLYRRSWFDSWPPDVTPSMQKRLRRARVMQIINSALFVATIAADVYAVVTQHWWQLLYAAFLALMTFSNFGLNRRTLRYLRELQANGETL